MPVITISRQKGSLGSAVASAVAARLGYRITWRELINEAARRAGAPVMALAVIDELGLLGLSSSPKSYRSYLDAVATVMQDMAKEGNVVIVGRAGQVILADFPDTLHVYVVAPLDVRVQRISDSLKIPLSAARAQLEASDHFRHSYLRRFYDVEWNDPNLYDLILNTSHMTVEAAANLICQAVYQNTGILNDRPI
jgi:cytidylate kinase